MARRPAVSAKLGCLLLGPPVVMLAVMAWPHISPSAAASISGFLLTHHSIPPGSLLYPCSATEITPTIISYAIGFVAASIVGVTLVLALMFTKPVEEQHVGSPLSRFQRMSVYVSYYIVTLGFVASLSKSQRIQACAFQYSGEGKLILLVAALFATYAMSVTLLSLTRKF